MATIHVMSSAAPRDLAVRHVRAPRRVVFPSEAEVPEGKRHYKLRTFLYQVLELALADRACIGCDQFVYWNARLPGRCLSPDAFVYLGAPDCDFESWKTWERGTPQLAVEIVSDPGTEIFDWDRRYQSYLELGVRELVRFDPDAPEGARVAVWDRVDDDLIERVVEADATPCLTLGLHWIVRPVEGYPAGLRLARDPEGSDLLLSPAEERDAARRRVAELEAELARRGG
jgi:Uma2 family endonuclease